MENLVLTENKEYKAYQDQQVRKVPMVQPDRKVQQDRKVQLVRKEQLVQRDHKVQRGLKVL